MEYYIIIIPVVLIASAFLVGGSVLVEAINSVERWITDHTLLLCLIVLAVYALIVYLLYNDEKAKMEKRAISKPLYLICSSLRALASATWQPNSILYRTIRTWTRIRRILFHL